MHFVHLATYRTAKRRQRIAQNNRAVACNFAIYSPISIFFTDVLSTKLFLMWLLTTP